MTPSDQYPPEAWPRVPTYAKRDTDGVWNLFVLCPFCGDRHEHGGGDDEAPGLGHRLSHCVHGRQGGEYVLVAGPKGMTKPIAQTRGWRNKQWRAGLDGKPPIPPVVKPPTEAEARRFHGRLVARGLTLRVDDEDRLIVSPAALLTDEDRIEIRRHKEPLVAAMKADARWVASRKSASR